MDDLGVLSIDYTASPTGKLFHRDQSFVRGVMGPFGSGKSVMCCFDIFMRMCNQAPSPMDGKRKTRWAVVRSTMPQLETTTINTWLDWFPEVIFGKMRRRVPMTHYVKFNDIEAEVIFLALDRPEDVSKLLSLELTGVWINEAKETVIEIIRVCSERVGRYPSKRDGGATWSGIIMDTNPPDDEHWWPILAGDVPTPDDWEKIIGWKFFKQPPAAFEIRDPKTGAISWKDNPNAENLENLPDKYYANGRSGKPHRHIRIYQGVKYGTTVDGLAIYDKEWNEDVHLANEPLMWIPGVHIDIGLDFGNTPAACFTQTTPRGQRQDIHELVTKGCGAERFALLLKTEIATLFPRANYTLWGDPSGAYKLQGMEASYFDILKANGLRVFAAPTPGNDWTMRREAGAASLERMVDGQPGYLLSPTCRHLRAGFNGTFRYKKINSSGSAQYDTSKPEKTPDSHIHEARQYAHAGAGEVKILKGHKKPLKSFKARVNLDVFRKQRRR